MSISSRILALSLASAAYLAGSATLPAQTLKSDDFEAATNTNATVVTGAPGTYTALNGNNLSVQSDNGTPGIGSGNALLSSPFATFSKFFTNFGEITLTPANPTITLNFDLRYTSAPASAGAQLRFGLFNQNGTFNATASESDPADPGYFVQTNPGANNATSGSDFVRDLGTSGGPLGGGSGGDTATFGSFGSIIFGTNPVNITFSISLTDTGLNFSSNFVSATGSASGTGFLSNTNANFVSPTFDSFVIGQGGATNTAFLIDNVSVVVVPEPGTWGLMVVGAACLVAMQVWRRRGRPSSAR